MGDEEYNRGASNWWESSSAAGGRTASSDGGAGVSTSGSSVVVFPPDNSMGVGLSSNQPPWNHPALILRGEKGGAEVGGGGGFRWMLEQGMGSEEVPFQLQDTSSSYGNCFQGGYHQQQPDDYTMPNSGSAGWNSAMAPSSFFSPLLIHQHHIPSTFHHKPPPPPPPHQHNVMDTSGPPARKTISASSSDHQTTAATTTTNKRSRNEASSTLPPFKVRKEKMGDRITALQQLVSPFGKTDTASVLSEAIEYIKFLHEQVNVLSTPYLKSEASLQHQQTSDKSMDPEGPRQDLRSRGLCLVPISSIFPVAHETTMDFWTPTFGGTFR